MTTSELSLFRTAMLQAWNAVVITSADAAAGYPVQIANPAFCKMTGYSLEDLQGKSLKMLQGPDTDPVVLDRLRDCLKEARFFEGMTTNYRKDGSSYVVRWNISPVRDDDGELTHYVSVQQDLSDFVQSQENVRLLAQALDATSDPILMTDAHARITFVNSAFSQLTGYSREELMGKSPALLRSGEHDKTFYGALWKSLQSGQDFKAQFINRRRDGSLYHAEQNISPLLDAQGHVTHYISISRDVTERVNSEKALRKAAMLDKLTGLFNRHHGEKVLSDAESVAAADSYPPSILLCDIDHFKSINDRHGHPVGDRVLRDVAQILRQAVRANDPIIRWGGEEFLILLRACEQTQAMELAERIRKRVEAHQDADVGHVTISLGLATLADGESFDQLIHRADQALYNSKRTGRNRVTLATYQDL
jgi:diguanylate cyclase (GGDEF)-like protein/PAS domain S-box-containing protein